MKNRTTGKLLSLILVLTMVLPLIGCAANSSQAGTSGAQEPAGEAAAQEAASEAQAGDPVQSAAGEAEAKDKAGETQEPAAHDDAGEAQGGGTAQAAVVESGDKEHVGETADDAEIRELISQMTTEEKLTQMMIVAFRSDVTNTDSASEISEDYADLIQKYDFGGIILFAGNMVDPAQTMTFIHGCQEAAVSSAHGIPMFVCVDQEGGRVNRVSFGTTGSGNMALAASGDKALAEESAKMMGEEIKALGFNMDFAPVSDVNSNPANPIIGVRAFSDDPQIVADYVTAFIKGLDDAGICTAIKHFPGHGNVGEDSHTHLPCSVFDLDEIRNCDLIPFQAGIDAGSDMIMTAHIQFPEIEKETYVSIKHGKEVYLPATLSRTIITGLLREQMGYDGVVITDAMDMGAITAHFDPIDAAVMAINADVDILLCSADLYKDQNTDTFQSFDNYMADLAARVENGDIKEEELDDSVYRILALKKEKGIVKDADRAPLEEQIALAESAVGTAANHAREWEIAQAGMTLLKNEGHALPAGAEESVLILYPSEARQPSVEYAVGRLGREGLADPSKVTAICYADLAADDEGLAEAASGCDKLIVLSESVSRNEACAGAIAQFHDAGKQVVLLCLNLPYDAACYEDADAVLCAYQPSGSAHDEEGNGPFNLNVAVALCTAYNESVPSGTLPVNVPKVTAGSNDSGGPITFEDELLYERGFGLELWGD